MALALLAPLHSGCAARPPAVAPSPSLLRLVTEPRTLTLCEGMRRHVAVSVSWAGTMRPDASGMPEITWLSPEPGIVLVDDRNALTGVRPGTVSVVVHGRLGSAYGRATLPVTVQAGRWDPGASAESGRTVCRPA